MQKVLSQMWKFSTSKGEMGKNYEVAESEEEER